MDRLTTTNKDVSREMICRNEDCGVTEEHCPHLMEDECYCLHEVINKLAEYEDAEEQCIAENQCGLRELLTKWKAFFDDIAELYEYRKAEEQGLLLRLACKVGDTVYRYCEYNGKVMEYEILNIHISSYASGGYDIVIEGVTEDDEGEEYEFCLSVSEFKNECFASREEAESALAEKGGAE